MSSFSDLKQNLQSEPKKWLITGVAGFIGSNLLEELLKLNQAVVGIDNFATGKQENLDDVRRCVSPDQWTRFKFVQGDLTDLETCSRTCEGVDYVLHQAALGSVPRSIADPLASHRANVDGFINIITASRDAKVKRLVYASSSSVYGDSAELPKVETKTGKVLSPYAATKAINELYADVFSRVYSLEVVGLRYFNVFGPRQDPNGAYAAVMPKWIHAMLKGQSTVIYGDGKTSRDFCFVANVIQANLLSATSNTIKGHEVFNVALNDRTTLTELFEMIRSGLVDNCPWLQGCAPDYQPFRKGDIAHSQADISKAKNLLGYDPEFTIKEGMGVTLKWYTEKIG